MSKNTFFRVHNDSTPAERRRVLRETGATYHAAALGDVGTIGGRYAAREKSTVIGSEPVRYPTLPPNSPWANEPVGLERPLGFSVEQMEPNGEPHELLAASLGEANYSDAGVKNPIELLDVASPKDAGCAPRGSKLPAAASRRPRHLFRKKS